MITFLRARAELSKGSTVATVGTLQFEPNMINVIPSRAVFTVDLRDPDEDRLREEEKALDKYLKELSETDGVRIFVERLARFEPVTFDEEIVRIVEHAAGARGLSYRRMTSGAGHDAQMMARIARAAMVFVPSVEGISHNPKEHTEAADLVAGADVLLDVIVELTKEG